MLKQLPFHQARWAEVSSSPIWFKTLPFLNGNAFTLNRFALYQLQKAEMSPDIKQTFLSSWEKLHSSRDMAWHYAEIFQVPKRSYVEVESSSDDVLKIWLNQTRAQTWRRQMNTSIVLYYKMWRGTPKRGLQSQSVVSNYEMWHGTPKRSSWNRWRAIMTNPLWYDWYYAKSLCYVRC